MVCTPPLTQCVLGEAADPCDPEQDKQVKKMDGSFPGHFLLIRFSIQRKINWVSLFYLVLWCAVDPADHNRQVYWLLSGNPEVVLA